MYCAWVEKYLPLREVDLGGRDVDTICGVLFEALVELGFCSKNTIL